VLALPQAQPRLHSHKHSAKRAGRHNAMFTETIAHRKFCLTNIVACTGFTRAELLALNADDFLAIVALADAEGLL
jgi:hypothetical protein